MLKIIGRPHNDSYNQNPTKVTWSMIKADKILETDDFVVSMSHYPYDHTESHYILRVKRPANLSNVYLYLKSQVMNDYQVRHNSIEDMTQKHIDHRHILKLYDYKSALEIL